MTPLKSLSDVHIKTIEKSWSIETCYPEDNGRWSQENPAIGQCAITALLVQEILGGEILYSKRNNHYWNLIHDREIDLTKVQFDKEIDTSDKVTVERGSLLKSKQAKTQIRYTVFKERFIKFGGEI